MKALFLIIQRVVEIFLFIVSSKCLPSWFVNFILIFYNLIFSARFILLTWELHGSELVSLYTCGCLTGVLAGLLRMGVGVSLTLLLTSGTLFFLLCCLIQPWNDVFFYLVLLHILMPCSIDITGRPASLWRKWRSSGFGRGLGKGKWGKVAFKIHCMREK